MAAQTERSNTIKNQQMGDPRTPTFTWRINNFSTLRERSLCSEFFIVGGHKWWLIIYPKGNNVKYFSMYLEVADSASLPSGWGIHARFSLGVINQINEIRFEPHVMCEPINKNFTYQYSELQDGDIVCFQKSLPVESADQFRHPDVRSFLEYVHDHQVDPKSIATRPISDADMEATYNRAGEVARSIASASTSVLPVSSVDEATNRELLRFFNLVEVPFEELATSRSSELLSCMSKIQTIAATVFTEDQQNQLNEMADQLQSKVDRVQHYHGEIRAKNDYIASIRGISSSILSNNGKEAELKQEDQQLTTEEQELREKLERVIKQRLDVRLEREKLYAETKDLLSRGKNGDAKIRAAKKELRQAQLKLKSLTDEWDFFKAQFF